VFPEGGGGEIGEADKELAAEMSELFIRYAYSSKKAETGSADDCLLRETRAVSAGNGKRDGPSRITVEVFGGAHGTGFVELFEEVRENINEEEDMVFAGELKRRSEEMKDALPTSATQYAWMRSKEDMLRDEELEREKLAERCAFMNTLTEQM
jgi:hypothetical protein